MKNYISKGKNWGLALLLGAACVSCSSELDQKPYYFTDEQILEILNSDKEQDQAKKNTIISGLCASLESNFRLNGNYNGYSNDAINRTDGQDIMLSARCNDIVVGTQENFTLGGFYINMYNLNNNDFQPWRGDQGTTGYNYAMWALPCNILTNANKVLTFVTDKVAAKGTPEVKNGRAAALCVRAYSYMMFMERYQKAYLHGGKGGEGMPIYKVYGLNDPVAPSSAEETFSFILGDLNEAVALFKEAGKESAGYTAETKDIDLAVAQYLRARVSLWIGDYNTCIDACEEIMSHYTSFISEANYGLKSKDFDAIQAGKKDVKAEENAFTFLAANPECILGWKDGDGAASFYYSNFNPFAGDGTGSNPMYMRVDDRIYNAINDNDYRKDNVLVESKNFTYFKGNTHTLPSYTSTKWGATICLQQTQRSQHTNTDQCKFRSSSVVLMLAEAYAESGNEAKAKEVLNQLLAARTREGAPALTCDNYKPGISLKDLIKLQWRIEMWGEGATEFYNAKRWNMPIDRAGSKIHWTAPSNSTLPVEYMTYEIPMQEYNFNPGWGR